MTHQYKHNAHIILAFVFVVTVSVLGLSCSGEDRSDEMPRVPVVSTMSAIVSGDSCIMTGCVIESHNSPVKECGFIYYSDSIASNKIQCDTTSVFSAIVDSLSKGEYFYAAYARNGMGTTYGDTLQFTVE